MFQKTDFILYQTPEGDVTVEVLLDKETIWLTQAQIAKLFGTQRPAVTKHIKNIFSTGELQENTVCSKMEHTAKDNKKYDVLFYNFDVILSVGYRVNSYHATQFRIWANSVLKNYLLKGYSVKDNLKLEQYEDLKKAIKILSNVFESQNLEYIEKVGLLKVLTDYAYALDILDQYDHQKLAINKTTLKKDFIATYGNAILAINELQKKFGGSTLFGKEKDQSFRSSIATIYQTFDSHDLYPSIEEKAAMLLYLIVKNHSFVDGNKRIAAFLFLWFLEKNDILYKPDCTKLIENNTLVALTLMIAESKSEEKEIIIKVIINLINKDN